jgi:hypothetical protein
MTALEAIRQTENRLTNRFEDRLIVNRDLNRSMVSFQANKRQNGYRWFKYKEGFSSSLIGYILDKLHLDGGRLIDPFAGSGAALFGAAERGLNAFGVELLPVGREIVEARKLAANAVGLTSVVDRWADHSPWQAARKVVPFGHLHITEGAFPKETEEAIGKYMALVEDETPDARTMLRFAAMCILEDISYTRKDGQYLRWDHRPVGDRGLNPLTKGKSRPLAKPSQQSCGKSAMTLAVGPGNFFRSTKLGRLR